jgi:hypothetical protein
MSPSATCPAYGVSFSARLRSPARSRCSPWPIGGCTAKDCDLQGSIDGAESSVLSGAKAYRETLIARANLVYKPEKGPQLGPTVAPPGALLSAANDLHVVCTPPLRQLQPAPARRDQPARGQPAAWQADSPRCCKADSIWPSQQTYRDFMPPGFYGRTPGEPGSAAHARGGDVELPSPMRGSPHPSWLRSRRPHRRAMTWRRPAVVENYNDYVLLHLGRLGRPQRGGIAQ